MVIMDTMDVWVLVRKHEESYYEHCEVVTIVCGVFTSLQAAKTGANDSILAMSSKDGVQWQDDEYQGAEGIVQTCCKGHYYMFCNCKHLDEWTYTICLCYLGDEEEMLAKMENA